MELTRIIAPMPSALVDPGEPHPPSFRAALERYAAPLTPAEQRLVDLALADPQECAFLSATQLAQRADAHESTVIRFAQKLGYDGYPALRAGLRADGRAADENPRGRWMRAAQEHELVGLVQHELRTLTQLPEFVTQEQVDAAARALLAARRIYVFGQDQWRTLVEFMARRLRRIGLDVVEIAHVGLDAAERMVSFGNRDVLLAFGVKRGSPELSRLLRYVHLRGGASILITDPDGGTTRPAPTYLLTPPRGTEAQRHTLLAPLLLCYALQFALTHLDPERVAEALQRLEELD